VSNPPLESMPAAVPEAVGEQQIKHGYPCRHGSFKWEFSGVKTAVPIDGMLTNHNIENTNLAGFGRTFSRAARARPKQ